MNANKPLPSRGHSSAPRFTGDALLLQRYFEDVEQICISHGVTVEADIIAKAIYYVDAAEEDTFKAVPAADRATWASYQQAVIKEYPGADDDRRYSVEDVMALVGEYAVKKEWTKADVGVYHRSFKTKTDYLIGKGRYSDGDRNRLFLKGFTGEMSGLMRSRLMVKSPDIHPADGYPLSVIKEAALYAVAGASAAAMTPAPTLPSTPVVTPTATTLGTVSPSASPAPDAVPVKSEQLDRSIVLQVIEELRAEGALMSRPAYPPRTTGRLGCNFCGTVGHILRECPDVQAYINARKIVREERSGMLGLPNGRRFPTYMEGSTMKEKLDHYYEERGPPPVASSAARDPPPHMPSVNIMEERPGVDIAWWNGELESDDSLYSYEVEQAVSPVVEANLHELHTMIADLTGQVHALQAAVIEGKKSVHFDATANGSRGSGNRGGKKAGDHTDGAGVPAAASGNTRGSYGGANANDGAYRLQCPIEDADAEPGALKTLLDTDVSVKVKTLFSLSPGLRRSFKDLCTAKRIPLSANLQEVADALVVAVTNAEQVMAIEEDSADTPEKLVAPDTLPLRCIRPVIAGVTTAECVLDPGSQIVAMRKDIWQRTSSGMDPSKCTKMVSANNMTNFTMGLVNDMTFEVAGVTLHLQVHVLEEAPFEVLLGRPFFAHSSCNSKDFGEDEQHLTLTDPNSGAVVTIPTQARVPPWQKKSSGF